MKNIARRVLLLACCAGVQFLVADKHYGSDASRAVGRQAKVRSNGVMDRSTLMNEWSEKSREDEEKYSRMGKYADIYRQQDAPFYARYSDDASQVSLGSQYSYACTAYSSAGIQDSMLQLLFGPSAVRVQDMLLASKLVKNETLLQTSTNLIDGFKSAANSGSLHNLATNKYLNYLADEVVLFKGSSHRVENALDVTHRIGKSKFRVGVHIPLIYAQNKVETELNFSSNATNPGGNIEDGVYGTDKQTMIKTATATLNASGDSDVAKPLASTGAFPVEVLKADAGKYVKLFESTTDTVGTPNAFTRRYGQNPDLFVKDILRSKGIQEVGGQSFGLGDMQVSIAADFAVKGVERAMAGVKVTLPTAQQTSTAKLWGPELGNGGHAALGFFGSALVAHSNWVNLHVDADCDLFASADVSLRIPKRVQATVIAANGIVPAGLMTFGDRVYGNNKAVNEFDTLFAGIGDNVERVRRTLGTVWHMRVGNVFMCKKIKRASLDVYYDMVAKLKDIYDGDASMLNTAVYEMNSQRFAHTLGATAAYQFSRSARAALGMSHVLAGRNVAKNWNFSALLNVSF